MQHKSCKSFSNTNLRYVCLPLRKRTSPCFKSTATNDPSTPQNAFRQESIKELLRSMKSLQISMMTQSSIDDITQLQISNHASSTAKRLKRIIQSSNLHNEDNQNYLIDTYQCISPSKTPQAIPSFLKKKFKELYLLENNETKNTSGTNSQCEHLKTEVKLNSQSNRREMPSVTLFNPKSQFNSPLNEKLTLNPDIKKRIDEYKRKKQFPLSYPNEKKALTLKHNKTSQKRKKRIDRELVRISTIQEDAYKYSRQLSKEILHENNLPSISSSRSKAHKKSQILFKVSSAYLETTNKIGKEKAKQHMKKAQNEYNIQLSDIIHKAIDSLINEDEKLKNKLDLDSPLESNFECKSQQYLTTKKSISQIEYCKEGFENINLDQKFNYNDCGWKKREKQKLMKKFRCEWDDQSFLKSETKKNHILKSMFPLTPSFIKYSKKRNSVNIK